MIHNDLKWLGTSIFSDSRGGSSGISQGNTVTPLTSTQIGSAHFSRSPEQRQWLFHCIPPLTSSHPTKALGYFQQTRPAASFSQRALTFVICVGNLMLMPLVTPCTPPPPAVQLTFMHYMQCRPIKPISQVKTIPITSHRSHSDIP